MTTTRSHSQSRISRLPLAIAAAARELEEAMFGNRGKVEKMVGAALPADARKIEYFRTSGDHDIAWYEAFARFDSTPESFRDFTQRLGMHAGASPHLPAAWNAGNAYGLAWWTPLPTTPSDACAKSTDSGGWIAAKYEDGHVFIMQTETGMRSGE